MDANAGKLCTRLEGGAQAEEQIIVLLPNGGVAYINEAMAAYKVGCSRFTSVYFSHGNTQEHDKRQIDADQGLFDHEQDCNHNSL